MYKWKGERNTNLQSAEGTVPYMAESVHQFELIGERDNIENMVLILLRMYFDVLQWETSKNIDEIVRSKRHNEVRAGVTRVLCPKRPHRYKCSTLGSQRSANAAKTGQASLS